MQIRHKRIDAGEACPLPRFQFLDRRARRGLAGQLGRRRHFGLELRLARLILGAALWTPILHAISHKIAKRAMACHFARRSGRFFQRQLDVQMGRRCNVDERIQGELGQLAAQQIIGPGPCQPKPLARFVL